MPASGSRSPASTCSSVDLPPPLMPTTPRRSPLDTVTDRSVNSGLPGRLAATPEASTRITGASSQTAWPALPCAVTTTPGGQLMEPPTSPEGTDEPRAARPRRPHRPPVRRPRRRLRRAARRGRRRSRRPRSPPGRPRPPTRARATDRRRPRPNPHRRRRPRPRPPTPPPADPAAAAARRPPRPQRASRRRARSWPWPRSPSAPDRPPPVRLLARTGDGDDGNRAGGSC